MDRMALNGITMDINVGEIYWWRRSLERMVRVKICAVLPEAPVGAGQSGFAPGEERRVVVIGQEDPFRNVYMLAAQLELTPLYGPPDK